ncbi:FixJ family transcriptional regulator [Oceanococcus atlanticus]|uniref:FixJ family transcriptional regulator n=2 Tax=Oceanococcus atlanticus TaxID=1317117 RepID=A0A1Y1SDT0_9GAMM|nr:FixJ family transcriptional regulator [Oceanococcus atlanticus]
MIQGQVFIIDDDEAVRDATVLLMQSIGLKAVAYADAQAFLDAAHDQHPACLILDVRMPGMSGLQLAREARVRREAWPIIFVTGHGDVPMAVEAMREGAFDFLQKPFREETLIQRVQRAIEQDHNDQVAASEREEIEERIKDLTPREREILQRIVDGESNKVIAIELGISARTVELHRANVMDKMQARSLAHLLRQVLSVTTALTRPD